MFDLIQPHGAAALRADVDLRFIEIRTTRESIQQRHQISQLCRSETRSLRKANERPEFGGQATL